MECVGKTEGGGGAGWVNAMFDLVYEVVCDGIISLIWLVVLCI